MRALRIWRQGVVIVLWGADVFCVLSASPEVCHSGCGLPLAMTPRTHGGPHIYKHLQRRFLHIICFPTYLPQRSYSLLRNHGHRSRPHVHRLFRFPCESRCPHLDSCLTDTKICLRPLRQPCEQHHALARAATPSSTSSRTTCAETNWCGALLPARFPRRADRNS